VVGDVDMHDPATVVSQHDKHEQHPALDGRHGEKITRHVSTKIQIH
jgi:hypothetical protein